MAMALGAAVTNLYYNLQEEHIIPIRFHRHSQYHQILLPNHSFSLVISF
jgi:hypothetical protein